MNAVLLAAQCRKLFTIAKTIAPEGMLGARFIPVTINGIAWELRYSTDRGNGNDVEFMLHLANVETRYARLGFTVFSDGRHEEDPGVIPDFDRTPNEPAPPEIEMAIEIFLGVLNLYRQDN